MAKSILIVDDSLSMRQVVSMVLKGAGYDVVEAVDGQDALAQLNGRRVHLILCDLNMPNLDGLSFARAAKQLPAYKFVPIVMLTTEGAAAKKEEGRASGLKAWMTKPFTPDRLLETVAKLVMP